MNMQHSLMFTFLSQHTYIHAHLHKVKTSSCCIAVAKLARQSHCKSNNNNTTKTEIYKW